MCMMGAGMMLGLLQGVIGFIGQVQQYNAAVAAHEQTVMNARVEATDQYAARQAEIRQEQAAAASKKLEGQIEAKETVAQQEVASGEAGIVGVGGYTANQLLGANLAELGRFNDNVDQNYQMVQQRLRAEMDQTEKRAQTAMNNSYSSLPPKPSPLSIFGSMSFG